MLCWYGSWQVSVTLMTPVAGWQVSKRNIFTQKKWERRWLLSPTRSGRDIYYDWNISSLLWRNLTNLAHISTLTQGWVWWSEAEDQIKLDLTCLGLQLCSCVLSSVSQRHLVLWIHLHHDERDVLDWWGEADTAGRRWQLEQCFVLYAAPPPACETNGVIPAEAETNLWLCLNLSD